MILSEFVLAIARRISYDEVATADITVSRKCPHRLPLSEGDFDVLVTVLGLLPAVHEVTEGYVDVILRDLFGRLTKSWPPDGRAMFAAGIWRLYLYTSGSWDGSQLNHIDNRVVTERLNIRRLQKLVPQNLPHLTCNRGEGLR